MKPNKEIEARLTVARLKELLAYDPETGLFTALVAAKRRKVGEVAGYVDKVHGYVKIRLDGGTYHAHRLVWFYMTGEWPLELVDHINRDRSDNRFSNLREATNAENQQNRKLLSSNTSGVNGVFWHRRDRCWQAQIRVNKRIKNLGNFSRFEDAVEARKSAEKAFYPFSTSGEIA